MSEGKRVVRQYPMEFKVDAVKLLEENVRVFQQVPAVSNLYRVRRTPARSLSILARTISTDDFYPRMLT